MIDYNAEVRVTADGTGVDPAFVRISMNPSDETARKVADTLLDLMPDFVEQDGLMLV